MTDIAHVILAPKSGRKTFYHQRDWIQRIDPRPAPCTSDYAVFTMVHVLEGGATTWASIVVSSNQYSQRSPWTCILPTARGICGSLGGISLGD